MTSNIVSLSNYRPKPFTISAYADRGEAVFARTQSLYSQTCEWQDRAPPISSMSKWLCIAGYLFVGVVLAWAGFVIVMVETN